MVSKLITITLLLLKSGMAFISSNKVMVIKSRIYLASTQSSIKSFSDVSSIFEGLLLSSFSKKSISVSNRTKEQETVQNKFDRINREEGRRRWVKEIYNLKNSYTSGENNTLSGVGVIVELAKELLYSGIPEQVLELYATYYDLIFQPDGKNHGWKLNNAPVIPDTKLILTTIRAFVAMHEVNEALNLLRSVSRLGMVFDLTAKSMLIADLADSSSEGLQTALHIHTSMEARNETISLSACSVLLRGIWKYGMAPSEHQSKYLLEPTASQEGNHLQGHNFRLSPVKARDIACKIFDSCTSVKRIPPKVSGEFLRVMFRTAAAQTKMVYDRNFQVDILRTRKLKAEAGIKGVTDAMDHFKISWDINSADVLLDECLCVGDVAGVQFVADNMFRQKIWTRTSTFNAILRRYAENGDGESAYNLVTQVMAKSPLTTPNDETWELLLEACSKTARGRCYSKIVLADLRSAGAMTKAVWERLLEVQILARESFVETLQGMIDQGIQPGRTTIEIMLAAFRSVGDHEGALRLHAMLTQAEEARATQRYSILSGGTDQGVPSKCALSIMLPPPSRRSCILLLEFLRDAGLPSEAEAVLREMVVRTSGDQQRFAGIDVRPIALTLSGSDLIGSITAPDVPAFATVIEAWVQAGNWSAALKVFGEMEALGLQADSRVYNALIRAFGERGDVSSALGVFQEMRSSGFAVDTQVLQTVLDVCLLRKDPSDCAQACNMLESLAEEGLDLQQYSGDILMTSFPDALSLGSALVAMESADSGPASTVSVGLDVLSAMAQACRTEEGVEPLEGVLAMLGELGVRPDKETMEYFRPPPVPVANSPNSRHYLKKLLPHKQKMRSVLDLEPPEELQSDVSLPERGSFVRTAAVGGRSDMEPYFNPGDDSWAEHTAALGVVTKGGREVDEEYEEDEDDPSAGVLASSSMVIASTGGKTVGGMPRSRGADLQSLDGSDRSDRQKRRKADKVLSLTNSVPKKKPAQSNASSSLPKK